MKERYIILDTKGVGYIATARSFPVGNNEFMLLYNPTAIVFKYLVSCTDGKISESKLKLP